MPQHIAGGAGIVVQMGTVLRNGKPVEFDIGEEPDGGESGQETLPKDTGHPGET